MSLKSRIERIMLNLFLQRHSRNFFLADIAGSVNVTVIEQDPTDETVLAYTDGLGVFMGSFMDTKTDDDITFVLCHELYHVALLHVNRRNSRDPELWNQACDYLINDALHKDGYSTNLEHLYNPSYSNHSEESLYEYLANQMPKGGGGGGSQSPSQPQGNGNSGSQGSNGQGQSNQNGQGQGQGAPSKGSNTLTATDVPSSMSSRNSAKAQAVVQSALASAGDKVVGNIAGNLEQYIDTMNVSEKNWNSVLQDFLELAFGEWEYNYSIPNRRFDDIFLPSVTDETENIKSIIFYIDTSGSVSDESVQKYLSEINYVKNLYNPDELAIKCFDTKIHSTTKYEKDEDIKKFKITGRGGTCFNCIKKDIEEEKPVCAIVFSDMYCAPMKPPKHKAGVLWVQYADEDNYAHHELLVGKKVHFPTI